MAPLTAELAETVQHLDTMLQLLTDLPEGQESSIPTQVNAFVDQMKKLETLANTPENALSIPLDLIEHLDKSITAQPIEEAILQDLAELDRLTTELRSTKAHYQSIL